MVDNHGDDDAADSTQTNSRRQFVIGSAGVAGGLAAGSAFTGSVFAQEDDGSGDDGTGNDGSEMPMEFEDDVAILNYALTLEYLEASFYRQGLEAISEEELCNCKALAEDSPLRDRAYGELETILEHEETHVETLRTTITDLGGEPIEEPEFDFGVRTEYPMAFLGTAVQLENVGVAAYAGAAPQIENDELVPPALSIHSVESRHAAFLMTLTDQSSFPDAFDEPRTREEVLELAGPFIVDGSDDEEMDPLDGNETADPTGNETADPTGNETDAPTGNETDAPTGNETDAPTGNETNTST